MNAQRLIRFGRVLLLSLCCICLSFGTRALAQDAGRNSDRALFLTTKLQHFTFGVNVGFEKYLSSPIALGGEVTAHCWLVPANISLASSLRYRLKGQLDKGVYAKGKVIGGMFFTETAIEDKPYYTGAGVGVGGILPLTQANRVYIFAELGLQFAVPFGNRPQSRVQDGAWGMAYYTLLSPASMPDVSVGIAVRL
jgi:hypothetical protein